MYKLPYFTEPDHDKVLQFMQAHPFVTLIGHDGAKSVATQIPVLINKKEDGQLQLRGHIMRKTDHCIALEQNKDVLVLFQGPSCYVSPSWYTEKLGGTFNYETVHARGTARIFSDEETMQLLTDLTAHFEAPQENPLYTDQLAPDYMPMNVKAIAGFVIAVEDVYPIFKLSQNRDDESYINIVKHLRAGADTQAHKIADEMVSRRPHLFA